MKHKRFDTKNRYFSNIYLLKVSTKDTETGSKHSLNTSLPPSSSICIQTQQQRDKNKHKDVAPVSLSLSLSKDVLLKIVMF